MIKTNINEKYNICRKTILCYYTLFLVYHIEIYIYHNDFDNQVVVDCIKINLFNFIYNIKL